MSRKSLSMSEIRKKYYKSISENDFIKIASADCISSNLQKEKLGKYAKWMLNLYKHTRFKLEDLNLATEYITFFDKIVKMNKLHSIDLNHYTSLEEMYQLVKPFVNLMSKKEKLRKIKEQEAEKLFEDEKFVVIHPITELGSILYGKGSKWCTAAKNNNNFRFYNSMGKLYIIIDKRNGKKYQFHAETKSFMDDENNYIDEIDINEIDITPKLDFFLKKIKIHPYWSRYFKTYYKDQPFYIVDKYSYVALYNEHFEEIFDEKFGADKIIPFLDYLKQNQLIIIKNNNIGIYYINTDTIQWGYRGVVEDKIDWI